MAWPERRARSEEVGDVGGKGVEELRARGEGGVTRGGGLACGGMPKSWRDQLEGQVGRVFLHPTHT